MSRRQFAEVPTREDGRVIPRYRLTCGECGCGETLGRQNFGPGIAAEQVPKKFEDKGWRVGKRQDGRDDRCPSCLNREQEARRRRLHVVQEEEIEPVAQNASAPAPAPQAAPPLPAAAEKPRDMTRDERRLIWAKLEDVYIDETRGYEAGWTDARVASDLGIPRAWVSIIREENFGPAKSEEIERLIKSCADLQEEKRSIFKDQTALNDRVKKVGQQMEEIDRIVRRLEASIR